MQNVFDIESGKVYVCDPCHKNRKELTGLKNVRKGKWTSTVEKENGINVSIICKSEMVKDISDWTFVGLVTVDSGLAGIFDQEHYYESDEDSSDEWYDFILSQIFKKSNANEISKDIVIPFGFVSHSGQGEGFYSVSVAHEGDEVIAILISFKSDDAERCPVCTRPVNEQGYCKVCDAYSDDKLCPFCMEFVDYDGICPECEQ